MRYLLSVTLTLLLAACTAGPHYTNGPAQWVGQPLDELVLAWGPPQGSHTLRDGRQVVEYRQQGIARRPGWGRSMMHGSRLFYLLDEMEDDYVLLQCSTRFVVDAQGTIEKWAWDGNHCR